MDRYRVVPGYAKTYSTRNYKDMIFNDRYGYAIAYYDSDPYYDIEYKIPELRESASPYLATSHLRSTYNPYIPKRMSDSELSLINLKAGRHAKEVMENYRPWTQKKPYESAKDYLSRKGIDSTIDNIRETCNNIHNICDRTRKYDAERTEHSRSRPKPTLYKKPVVDDIILSSQLEHIDNLKNGLSKDMFNHRDKFRVACAGARASLSRTSSITEEDKEKEKPTEVLESTSRKNSREIREETLQVLNEKLKRLSTTDSDAFERSYGKTMSRLRGDIDRLAYDTEFAISDTRHKDALLSRLLRK